MTVAATFVLGLVTGVLSGMFGVGGAVISTPGIRALGAPPLDAVGTTLPAMLPSALSGSLRYRREGLLSGRIIGWVAGVGAAIAVATSFAAHAVPGDGHWLMVATAVIILYTAVKVAQSGDRDLAALAHGTPEWRTEPWRLGVCGAGAGAMSGLLGLGGGTVLVPAFLGWLRMPIKATVANSLACVGLLAVPSTIAHWYLGDIDWAYALPLAIAVAPGARLGAHLAITASDRTLRLVVASGLAVIAVVYAARELMEIY
ncbi:MAG TPA: sulfite exporter TauE/SafE family protein [Acidimicrobiia bacterium]|nr:sulfite exporter TauE/SafE family protein [Acidimicrobiia bacterium]